MDDLIEAAIGSVPCDRIPGSLTTNWVCGAHGSDFVMPQDEECYEMRSRRHQAELMIGRILPRLRDRIASVIANLEPDRSHWIGCADVHNLCWASHAIQTDLTP